MTKQEITLRPSQLVRSMHPQKFAMWLFIVSIIMIFISLSSAYIVKKGAGHWQYIEIPSLFKWNTLYIVLSSIAMQWAYVSAKRNNLLGIRLSLSITGFLALLFIVGQFYAWEQLVAQGAFFIGNPASSFIYVFTGLHITHLVGGIIFLSVVLLHAFQYKVHSKKMNTLEMCTTYWHFLGGLWIYLYVFLLMNN